MVDDAWENRFGFCCPFWSSRLFIFLLFLMKDARFLFGSYGLSYLFYWIFSCEAFYAKHVFIIFCLSCENKGYFRKIHSHCSCVEIRKIYLLTSLYITLRNFFRITLLSMVCSWYDLHSKFVYFLHKLQSLVRIPNYYNI